jgi:nucleoside-diphosphate-sugar epimerase
VYRKSGYLFSKIFQSILNKQKIEIGDTYYYRDMIHPKMVVDLAIKNDIIGQDFIVGSGHLTYVNEFIRKLYNKMNMNYDDFVTENVKNHSIYRKNVFYNSIRHKENDPSNLLKLTIKELRAFKNENI